MVHLVVAHPDALLYEMLLLDAGEGVDGYLAYGVLFEYFKEKIFLFVHGFGGFPTDRDTPARRSFFWRYI
jgi:hypothetical protein